MDLTRVDDSLQKRNDGVDIKAQAQKMIIKKCPS